MLDFLYTAVSWVLLRWHDFFTLIGFSEASGLNWALSIVFLVITARVLLFRLFIKQVHYQRAHAGMQPKISEAAREVQERSGRDAAADDDAAAGGRVQPAVRLPADVPADPGLHRRCYHVLRHLSNSAGAVPAADRERQRSADAVHVHQAGDLQVRRRPSSSARRWPRRCHDTDGHPTSSAATSTATRIVHAVLVLISAAATFATQLLVRASAVTSPRAPRPPCSA